MSESGSSSPPSLAARPAAFALGPLLWPAALLLAALALRPLERAGGAIAFPYALDREEGFLLNQAVLLARGETIYPPLGDLRWLVGNYPPLYPAVFALGVKVFGASLGVGRAICLAAGLALLGALGWAAWRETRSRALALLAPALLAATWDFNQWLAFARVDIPALALTFAGLLRFAANPRRGGARGTAALFALALLTRQTALAAPLACFAWLLVRRERRAAALFALRLGLCAAIPYLALLAVTRGEAWRHLVVYNANPYFWDQTAVWARHLWRFQRFALTLLVLSGALLSFLSLHARWAGEAAREAKGGPEQALPKPKGAGRSPEGAEPDATASASAAAAPLFSLAALYLPFAFGSFLLVGKEGAAANYLLEWHLAAALFLALAAGRILRLDLAARAHGLLGFLKVLFFLGITFHAAWLGFLAWRGMLFSERPPTAIERLTGVELDETLERLGLAGGAGALILSDDPVCVLRAGGRVVFQPFILSALARQGLWDPAEFESGLARGRFAAIITTQDLFNEDQFFWAWTPSMRRAIREAYEPRHTIAPPYPAAPPRPRYWIYTPAPQAPRE